jgi:hypothetical protein
LPDNYFTSPVDQLGLQALRWRALSGIVPPDYSLADAFPTIDTGASWAVRLTYLERYRDIMQMSRAALAEFANEHPLPTGFKQGISAVPLYWYVGFQPTDDLGIAVYTESLVSRSPDYLQRVINGLETWGVFQADIVPFDSMPQGLLLEPEQDASGFEHYSVPRGEYGPLLRYWSPAETIWAPGMVATERLSELLLPRIVEICLALFSFAAILRMEDRRRRTVASGIFSVTVAFAITSSLLVGVRDKELISLLPTVSILYALGMSWIVSLARGLFEGRAGTPGPNHEQGD